jgi:hypothetical protein
MNLMVYYMSFDSCRIEHHFLLGRVSRKLCIFSLFILYSVCTSRIIFKKLMNVLTKLNNPQEREGGRCTHFCYNADIMEK